MGLTKWIKDIFNPEEVPSAAPSISNVLIHPVNGSTDLGYFRIIFRMSSQQIDLPNELLEVFEWSSQYEELKTFTVEGQSAISETMLGELTRTYNIPVNIVIRNSPNWCEWELQPVYIRELGNEWVSHIADQESIRTMVDKTIEFFHQKGWVCTEV